MAPRGPVMVDASNSWPAPYTWVKRPPTILDYANRVAGIVVDVPKVVYTYPVGIERQIVLDFVAAISVDGGGTSAMYKILARFKRAPSANLALVSVVKTVADETVAGLDVDFAIATNDLQITVTGTGSPSDWFLRLYGVILETPIPVSP